MDLNITNLKYFFDTLKSGSVNKAAQINHVSQPAVSQGIRKLEDQVGVRLLAHKRNRIAPTQDGQYLFLESQKVFTSIDELKDKIQNLNDEVSGIIRIGCSNSLAKAILFPKIKKFETQNPNVKISINVGKTRDQIRGLKFGDIDLGITIDNEDLKEFDLNSIYQGQFVLVGKKSCENRFLVTEPRPEVRQLRDALSKNSDPPNFMEVESWDLLYEMSKNGLGYAFIPDLILKTSDRLHNYNKKFNVPSIPFNVVSFTRKEAYLNTATQLFLDGLNS